MVHYSFDKMIILLLNLFILLLLLLQLSTIHGGDIRAIKCRDADVGGSQLHNNDRKFLIIGSHSPEGGAGLGNMLIFFPAAYYFSVFTNRDIIISDHSLIGSMCSVIQCGFPFVSDLQRAFPNILTESNVINAPSIKAYDFNQYIELSREIDEPVVRAAGFMSKSDWWVYYYNTTQCVSRITGCVMGDIACADRHAYQRLIRGPFRTSLSEKEENRIFGVPDFIKHSILTLPHSYAPRLDAAIHLRCQFHHFEQNTDINDPEYRFEVATWLNSTEATEVFESVETKLIELISESRRNQIKDKNISNEVIEKILNETVYVYLASDNEEVKDHFSKILENRHDSHLNINVMRVETKFIHHVKNIAQMIEKTQGEGLLDLIFDWYSLSLSNLILGKVIFISHIHMTHCNLL